MSKRMAVYAIAQTLAITGAIFLLPAAVVYLSIA
jgi:hypothetical protein